MKHVYPPRHPAWLDDKAAKAPPAAPDSPQPEAPREQGATTQAAPGAPERQARSQPGEGGTRAS
ncbi:MAG TPA: hypothetical protein VIN75_04130 [Burkholderiaceae bacterium]